jgi:hypothetical protein
LFWAAALCALLTGLSLVNAAAGIAFALGLLVVGASLWCSYVIYRAFARRSPSALLPSSPEPPLGDAVDHTQSRRHRWNRPDTKVALSMLVASAPPVIAGLATHGRVTLAWVPHPVRLSAVMVMAGTIAAAIYVATLVDWYCILPRLSGLICLPPCRSSAQRRWITVTRAWLTNRWLSIVLGAIVCGSGLIGSIVYYLTALPGGVAGKDQLAISFGTLGTALLVAGISVGLRFNLLDRLNDMLNPTRTVGRLVRYQSSMYYVVDVSLQGTKINAVMSAGRYAGEPFPAGKGELVDPGRLVVAPQPYSGCSRVCSGVNFYCDNNWRKDRYT